MSAYRDGAIATWTVFAVAAIWVVTGALYDEVWICMVALLAQTCFYGGLILGRYIERRHRAREPVRPLYTLGVKPALVKAGIKPDDWERVVPYSSNDSDCPPVEGHAPWVRRTGPDELTWSCSCGWRPLGQNPDDELAKHIAIAYLNNRALGPQ